MLRYEDGTGEVREVREPAEVVPAATETSGVARIMAQVLDVLEFITMVLEAGLTWFDTRDRVGKDGGQNAIR